MDRATLILSLMAFILVALATPFQLVGVPLAPIVAVVMGAVAGWWTLRIHREQGAAQGARAGALVGVAALLGAVVALGVIALGVGSLPAVQDYVRASEPHPEARIPVELITPLATVGGVMTGFVLGVGDLILSALAGWVAALLYRRGHAASV